jgi:beta-glucanase (GH16 family)
LRLNPVVKRAERPLTLALPVNLLPITCASDSLAPLGERVGVRIVPNEISSFEPVNQHHGLAQLSDRLLSPTLSSVFNRGEGVAAPEAFRMMRAILAHVRQSPGAPAHALAPQSGARVATGRERGAPQVGDINVVRRVLSPRLVSPLHLNSRSSQSLLTAAATIKGANYLSLVIVALLALFLCPAALAQSVPGWTLVWSDEFAQPDGSSPDSAKWGYDIGGSGWGNNELQYYTSRTNNARIENGQLVIEAKQEVFSNRNYTSARLLTKGKHSWTYGRFEARIKIPRGQGIWPAFWTLGTNINTVPWPNCGEIDLMENIGSIPTRVHGTIHGPGYSGGNGIGGSYTLPGGAVYADDFHTFVTIWETNRIRWYMDGHLYFTVTPGNLPGGANWVFNQPHFLLLNLAVGGNWPGPPNGSTTFPQRMIVDYVRVYAASNSVPATNTACNNNVLPNPGFELGGLANWNVYGAGFNTLLENGDNLPVHAGTNIFKVFGQFTGSENYSGLFRDTPAAPGATFTANGWALTPTGDNLAGANTAWIEVSFRNANEDVLAMFRSAILNSSTPGGSWLNLAVTNQLDVSNSSIIGTVTNLVAPDGTAFVRYQVVFRQPANAAGAVLFDDLSLNVPDGTAPVSVVRDSNQLNLSFPTYAGLTYQIRYKTNLADGLWQVLTNVTGDGGAHVVTDALGASQKYYRVLRVCN